MNTHILVSVEAGVADLKFDYISINEWKNEQEIMRELKKKFPLSKSFAVWSFEPDELKKRPKDPSLLFHGICMGTINSARDILTFIPNENCNKELKDKIEKSPIKIMQTNNNGYTTARDYQALFLKSVVENMGRLCDLEPQFIPHGKDWRINTGNNSHNKVYLMVENEPQQSLWQRLGNLNISPLTEQIQIYYLKKQPDGIGLSLERVTLTFKNSFKRQKGMAGKTNKVTAQQDEAYFAGLVQDTFRGDKPSQQCYKTISDACNITSVTFSFKYNPDPSSISKSIIARINAENEQRIGNISSMFRVLPRDINHYVLKQIDIESLNNLHTVCSEITEREYEIRFKNYFPMLYLNMDKSNVNWSQKFIETYEEAYNFQYRHFVEVSAAIAEKDINKLNNILDDPRFDFKYFLFTNNGLGQNPIACARMNGFKEGLELIWLKVQENYMLAEPEMQSPALLLQYAIATGRSENEILFIISNHPVEKCISIKAYQLAVETGMCGIERKLYSELANALIIPKLNNPDKFGKYDFNVAILLRMFRFADFKTINYFVEMVAKDMHLDDSTTLLSEMLDNYISELGDSLHFIKTSGGINRDTLLVKKLQSIVNIMFDCVVSAINDNSLDAFNCLFDKILQSNLTYKLGVINRLYYKQEIINGLFRKIIFINTRNINAYNAIFDKLISAGANPFDNQFINGKNFIIERAEDYVEPYTMKIIGPSVLVKILELVPKANAEDHRNHLDNIKFSKALIEVISASEQGKLTDKQIEKLNNTHSYGFLCSLTKSFYHPILLLKNKKLQVWDINSQKIIMKKLNVEALKTSTERSDAQAQYKLAKRYEYGNGVLKNPALAFDLYRRAARHGHMKAMECVARIYKENGNSDLADKWRTMLESVKNTVRQKP